MACKGGLNCWQVLALHDRVPADPTGRSFIVDLSQEKTVGEVLKDINGAAGLAGSDVTAAINADGNGILLQATTGDGSLAVTELNGGTTAKDLNIALSAPEADRRTINGAFERTIQVSADDTLDTLVERINNLGIGITASILDDGSATAPKRLQLVSDRPGAAGRIIVRGADGTGLSFNRIAEGYDAVLFLGGQGGRPVVIRSSTNEFRDVVKGLSVTAKAVSETPVTVTATRDLETVRTAIQDLVESYNEVMDDIRNLTRFDVTSGTKGPLLGESSLRNVERQVSAAILRPVLGMGFKENLASQIGLRITTQGKLSFKQDEFDAVASSNPDAIRGIFTQYRPLEERVKLSEFGNGEGVTASNSGPEMRIHRRDGTTFDVDLTGDTNFRELLASINEASGNNGTVKATLSSDSRSILLTDSTVGVTAFAVKSMNGSPAYRQLGLDIGADSAGGGVMTGRKIDLQGDYGVARRLADVLKTLTDSTGGLLSTRAENFQSQIDELNKRMESKKESMAARETQLRRQFAQLESLMGQNQNTLQRLTAGFTSWK